MKASQKSECPLCLSSLQRTVNRWDTDVVWDRETEEVVDWETWGDDSPPIYCGKDHTYEEMEAEWAKEDDDGT